jgi:DNA-binding CsgD family transcriptional regulator/tetratricopeptide (TPR) repeat protein
VLQDRHSECEVLDRLLEAVRRGESRVLVVRGEPGVGKSALLEYVVTQASGCRVARAAYAESEMELAFAGLHQLCAPLLNRVDQLPGPQRDALGTAFGLRAGNSPDRFLVGLAVLSLFSERAEEQPLVCVVDDAQWLDRASVLTLVFVARRLLAESVGLIFAVRELGEEQELAGLTELVVEGLNDDDARALLDSAIHGRLDEEVRERFIAETRGNPLALLELPREWAPTRVAGGFGLPDSTPLVRRIEQSFLRRLHSLPRDTQRFLQTAAAEPVGDLTLLLRAVERLGIGADAAAPAEAAGLVELGARVRFRHPLVRSAIYSAASPQERRDVHRALAGATDPEVDPDRRAWHRAHAALGPDEAVASELERSAGRAQARGGFAGAAAFLERATKLTPDPARRGARALAAAQAKFDAAAPDSALALLAAAEIAPLDELQHARVDVLRAQIEFARGHSQPASALLLAAAKRLEPLDAELARVTYLEAFGAALFAGRLSGPVGVRQVADAARAAARTGSSMQPPRPLDLLLDGLVTRFTEGYPAGVAPLRRALGTLQAVLREHGLVGREVRFAWGVSPELWDDDAWHELASRGVGIARDRGALTALPIGLTYHASLLIFSGRLKTAAVLLEEADAIAAATGNVHFDYASPLLAAVRGRETDASAVIEAAVQHATARGEGRAIPHAEHAAAVLYNGLGRYQGALAAAQRACEYEDLGVFGWALVELIEAGARTGNREAAAAALEQLAERTGASATDWGLGMEARSRALLADTQTAEPLYHEAIERLTRSRISLHLARAHLLYGEWLRRERRRTDARHQLRTARQMFLTMGAEGFAERTERELLATGERARKRTGETTRQLTPQETQIAQLARDGLSNPEIGAQLFISPRTVQYHLHMIFTKLGIGSRMELNRVLPGDPSVARRGSCAPRA